MLIVTLAVVLSPASILLTMVLAVPFGPRPVFIKRESMTGVLCPALAAVAVASGFGVIICEFLQVLQISRLAVCMAFMLSTSQLSPGKQIWICVTAAERRLVMFPILSLRLTKPPQAQSPFIAESKAKQIPQLVISRLLLTAGTKEQATMLTIRTPAAQIIKTTVTTRSYRLEQGSLSMSLRMHSQGGQLRSKRQHSTMQMQKQKQTTAKIMQGISISLVQLSSQFLSPETTIFSTLCLLASDLKPAQMKDPMVATVVSEVELYSLMLNCAGQLSIVISVQPVAKLSTSAIKAILQLIYFITSKKQISKPNQIYPQLRSHQIILRINGQF